MIVQYNKILAKGKNVNDKSILELTSNNPIEGFEKKTTITGKTIYKRLIQITEAERIYNISFSGQYNGFVFPLTYNGGKFILHDRGRKCAVELGFREEEKDLWLKEVDSSEMEKFFAIEYDYITNTETTKEISEDDVYKLYELKKKYR